MGSKVPRFFSAWGVDDPQERDLLIAQSLAPDATYADPMTAEPIVGPDAVSDYVANFRANAPGWSAWVVEEQEQHGTVRASVAFGENEEPVQYGQYFVESDDNGQISRMVGFVGRFTHDD